MPFKIDIQKLLIQNKRKDLEMNHTDFTTPQRHRSISCPPTPCKSISNKENIPVVSGKQLFPETPVQKKRVIVCPDAPRQQKR